MTQVRDWVISEEERLREEDMRRGEEERWLRDSRSVARLTCPHCGTEFRMCHVLWELLAEFPPSEEEIFYTTDDLCSSDCLWLPCPTCNQAGRIPPGFRALTHAEAVAWVEEKRGENCEKSGG